MLDVHPFSPQLVCAAANSLGFNLALLLWCVWGTGADRQCQHQSPGATVNLPHSPHVGTRLKVAVGCVTSHTSSLCRWSEETWTEVAPFKGMDVMKIISNAFSP